jgi:hypothetical protein
MNGSPMDLQSHQLAPPHASTSPLDEPTVCSDRGTLRELGEEMESPSELPQL